MPLDIGQLKVKEVNGRFVCLCVYVSLCACVHACVRLGLSCKLLV
jgi:hypothetical protein